MMICARFATAIAAALCACSASALTFTLDSPTLTLTGALSSDVSATLVNDRPDIVFLAGVQYAGFDGLTLDDSAFYANVPVSLDPAATWQGTFLSISNPSLLTGPWNGTITLVGGLDDAERNNLASANLVVQTVPEPISLTALAIGAGVMCLRRRGGRR